MNLLLRSCRRADARLGRYLATQPAPTESFGNPHAHQSRTSLLTKLSHSPGSLHDVLKYFWKNDVNLTHIESRPCPKDSDGFHVVIDFDGHVGDAKTDRLLSDLSSSCADMLILDEREVPWFPRHISELDALAVRCLDAGTDLQADHPGFSDPLYRARRSELARIAEQYRFGEPIPYVEYTAEEVSTWAAVYDNLHAQHRKHACAEYLSALPLMERHCGYARDRIPQAQDISDFLMSRTGFQVRLVCG
jgi:phenylalanine-4-hydroxylase